MIVKAVPDQDSPTITKQARDQDSAMTDRTARELDRLMINAIVHRRYRLVQALARRTTPEMPATTEPFKTFKPLYPLHLLRLITTEVGLSHALADRYLTRRVRVGSTQGSSSTPSDARLGKFCFDPRGGSLFLQCISQN